MSAKSDRAIEAMMAALAEPPEWIEIKSRRTRPFIESWSALEGTMAIGTKDEHKARVVGLNFYKRAKPGEAETSSATPDAAKRAFESVMLMLGDAIVREEYGDLLAVAELLEDRRTRRFRDEVARWVKPLIDAKSAPEELKAEYCALVERCLPAELGQIDSRARKLKPAQVADAIGRARSRSVEAIAAWLAVFSFELDLDDAKSMTLAHGRWVRRFRGLRDRQEEKRIDQLKK